CAMLSTGKTFDDVGPLSTGFLDTYTPRRGRHYRADRPDHGRREPLQPGRPRSAEPGPCPRRPGGREAAPPGPREPPARHELGQHPLGREAAEPPPPGIHPPGMVLPDVQPGARPAALVAGRPQQPEEPEQPEWPGPDPDRRPGLPRAGVQPGRVTPFRPPLLEAQRVVTLLAVRLGAGG